MLLAIDIGNTNITHAAVPNGEPGLPQRAKTDAAATVDQLAAALGGLDEVDEIVLASVVPALTDRLAELTAARGIRLLIADHTTVPIEMRVDNPAEVGADRLVNALAALRLYGAPAIVVDFGTATNFDVVAADGAYVGGALAPGLELGIAALAEKTARLPRIVLAAPPAAIGRNTVAAMQSGAVIGYLGLVRGLVDAISAELAPAGGPAPTVILTGGLSAAPWAADLPGVTAIDPQLTLRGLAILHTETVAHSAAAATSAATAR
jgi:type III pantothenate kinase